MTTVPVPPASGVARLNWAAARVPFQLSLGQDLDSVDGEELARDHLHELDGRANPRSPRCERP